MGVVIPTATRCLLCGARFAPEWGDPKSEQPNGVFLLCAAHGAEDLTAAGLQNIWIGSGNWAPDLRPGRGGGPLREIWLTPAGEDGLFTVVMGLDSGDLLVIGSTYANVDVAWLRPDVVVAEPEGLVDISAGAGPGVEAGLLATLRQARRDGWYLSWVQRHWDGLALRFNRAKENEHLGTIAGERLGSVLFSARALGRKIGPQRYGLRLAWQPAPA